MTRYLDSSVLVSSLLPDDPDYTACDALMGQPGNWTSPHALNETFATLTGGRLGTRIDADVAARMIRESIRPCVQFVELTVDEILAAQAVARQQSVRGGGVYDYMHLTAARKIKADKVITIDLTDFQHLHREGDPEIERPC
jgi:predicted nucleic acid-binding protein